MRGRKVVLLPLTSHLSLHLQPYIRRLHAVGECADGDEIHPGQRTGAGWFTDKNFQPGDRIVVAGAQVLVAEEMRAQGAGGSEE